MKSSNTSNRLKDIMSARDLKQVDILRLCAPFCDKYGIKLNKNDLSQYVSGKVIPGQDKLTILGLALGVDEVWLMGYDTAPAADPTSDAPPELSEEARSIGFAYDRADDGTKTAVAKLLDVKRTYSEWEEKRNAFVA